MKKLRLDEVLRQKGIVKDKADAFVKVTEGVIFIDGRKAISPAQLILPDTKIEIKLPREFVGRGAWKLEAALKNFGLAVGNKVAADIGASTGGFTEVLLKRGARKVYAVDTAYGKLDLKLREDSRVVVLEKTDIRSLKKLPEEAKIVTIDVSLSPLQEILPSVRRIAPRAKVIALFKPQYQTRDKSILRHGVVKNPADREKLLQDFQKWCKENNWEIQDYLESPIRGDKGNVEYLLYLKT